MKYTIHGGVERRFSDRFSSNYRFLLPLVAILALVVFWGLGNHGSKKQNPLALGIYTIKSNDNTSGNKNTGNKNKSDKSNSQAANSTAAASPMSSGLASAAGIAGGSGGGLQGGTLSGAYSTASGGGSSVPSSGGTLTGGMGGGGSGGSTLPTGGGTTSTTPITSPAPTSTSTPVGTVECDNTGGLLPMTCTACTVPLVIQPGQKAILSSNGTCVAVN